MIINYYRFTKNRLQMTIKLLKHNYAEGWDDLHFRITKDNVIQLTDGEVNDDEGFVFGLEDYNELVTKLNTEDVSLLTEDVYLMLTDKETYLYKYKILKKLNELKVQESEFAYAYVGNTKVESFEEAIAMYKPEWDLELAFTGDKKMLIRYRGKSVVFQMWDGTEVLEESEYTVNEDGESGIHLTGAYRTLVTN